MSGLVALAQEGKDDEIIPIVGMVGEETPADLGTTMAGEFEGNRRPVITREYSGWDVYNNEGKEVDTELVNDWRDSLNSLLLFAAIFAAVLTAFIIESKKLLEPNSADVMLDVVILPTNNLANGTRSPYIRPQFEPTQSAINVNCLFFASLSTSLVAVLASVVALHWVADYDAAITRGGSSPEDRAKRPQFRYSGVVWWKMSGIIAVLPILLYYSVILFFGGIILWMWEVSHMVGFVVAGGAALAILFYGRHFVDPFIILVILFSPSFIFLCILCSLHKPSIPAWLERRYQAGKVSRKREDNEVEHRSQLAMDALVWLANHLSISQDSYDRLLLLVSEFPKLEVDHFLLYLFNEVPGCKFFVDMTAYSGVPIKRRTVNPLLMLLVLSDEYDEHASEELHSLIRQECLDQILEIIRTVERSPLSLFALLIHLSDSLVKRGVDYPEDIALFAICVDKALCLPRDQRVAQTITPLVGNVRRLASVMCTRERGTPKETQLASSEVMRTIYRLNTRLALMGRSNGRALACARTHGSFSPAIGWLGLCIE